MMETVMARRRFLEETISTELTPFSNIAPTSGFFTYCEFYKADNCELLNQTMTVISLSEQDEMQEYHFVDKHKNAKVFDASRTQKVLSHLIEATKNILAIEKEKNLKHTPIIALTANALATDRARFLGAGMDEFVAKPIDNEFLIRVLHSFLLTE